MRLFYADSTYYSLKNIIRMSVTIFLCDDPRYLPNGSRMKRPVLAYTFECQYAKAINTAWNGSLPQANAGDIFIAAPFVWAR